MNIARIATCCVGGLALLGAVSAQAQTISRGEVIATTCYTCHGTLGASPSTIPSIDYIPPERMVETLKGFRSGTRYSSIMGRHVSAYTDEELAEVAAHFGKLQKKGK